MKLNLHNMNCTYFEVYTELVTQPSFLATALMTKNPAWARKIPFFSLYCFEKERELKVTFAQYRKRQHK